MLTVKDTTTSIGEQCVYCVRTQRPASKVKWRRKWVAAARNWVLVGTRTRTTRDWDAYGRDGEESRGLAGAPRVRRLDEPSSRGDSAFALRFRALRPNRVE